MGDAQIVDRAHQMRGPVTNHTCPRASVSADVRWILWLRFELYVNLGRMSLPEG